MSRYLLDTNHLSETIRPTSTLRPRLRQARKAGHVLGVCIPVLGELEAGILQTADPDAYHQRLRKLMSVVQLWPLDQSVGRQFGAIFVELRRRGRVLSQIDMLSAALCRHMNLVLLTNDADFEALPDIRCENWLSASASAP